MSESYLIEQSIDSVINNFPTVEEIEAQLILGKISLLDGVEDDYTKWLVQMHEAMEHGMLVLITKHLQRTTNNFQAMKALCDKYCKSFGY